MFVVAARNVALGVYPTMGMAMASVRMSFPGEALQLDVSSGVFGLMKAPDGEEFTIVKVKLSEVEGELF